MSGTEGVVGKGACEGGLGLLSTRGGTRYPKMRLALS